MARDGATLCAGVGSTVSVATRALQTLHIPRDEIIESFNGLPSYDVHDGLRACVCFSEDNIRCARLQTPTHVLVM